MKHLSQDRTVKPTPKKTSNKIAAKTYTLDSKGVEEIFQQLQIPVHSSEFILFALRGFEPIESEGALTSAGPLGSKASSKSPRPQSSWSKKITLTNHGVDHLHMHCTLGIWDRKNQRIFAAIGSTVPHKSQVDKAAARPGKAKGKGANQLEPGYYTDLTKGEHLQGKVNGHQALRQTASRFYRRSPKGLPYSEKSPLYFGNPYDNLHCGWNLEGKESGFSSAGCLVVAGLPHCPRREDMHENQGAWKIFHDLIYGIDQKIFPLLLISEKNLQILLKMDEQALPKVSEERESRSRKPRLVYGSTGPLVKELQRKLKLAKVYLGPVHGRLDARTYKAWEKIK